ncbi:hypothetical protein U1Q18_027585 [Sarracenia purpurea var. burkii]
MPLSFLSLPSREQEGDTQNLASIDAAHGASPLPHPDQSGTDHLHRLPLFDPRRTHQIPTITSASTKTDHRVFAILAPNANPGENRRSARHLRHQTR